MFNRTKAETRLSILACLFVLGLITAVIVLPFQFGTQAAGQKGLFQRTSVEDDGLPKMWDIREQKGDDVADALLKFRQSVGKDSAAVANTRDEFARGEATFKQRHPDAKVEYNNDIRTPEVMTPDVYKSRIEWLSAPSSAKRADILRNFIRDNQSLIGVNEPQIDGLKVTADYTNPDGNLSFARLEQEINGIPVFRGEVTAGFTKSGQIIRVINNLAPGLDYGSLSTTFGDPVDAVRRAAGHINHDIRPADVARNAADSTDLKVVFGQGDWATTAEKMYFPTEPGVAVPSWRVLVWRPVNAYYVIVDANTGVVLWHKNIADDQTTSKTYQVYGNSNAYTDIADSPAPLTPGPIDPSLGTQGALITRTTRSLIGNEGTLSFNNNGWITDGQDKTDGNAVEAGIDRDGTNGVDPASVAVGSPANNFDSTWNPPPGSPAPGDEPLTAQAQRGAVIQMFYAMNRYHDELYKRGFTEQARNFQGLNFGRGGVENDRVSAEGQDSSGTNNANFATPADGGRGRMQMFLWTGPAPDKDGTTDIEVVIHEVTHGTSNRLHNNGSGLGNQGGMMGEGWSDWYAHVMLAEPTDPINGIYTTGGYATHLLSASFTANYYYGIRRFPKAVIAFTGGPQNKPHNPLTFGHLNVGCDTTLGTTTTAVSSAFPRSPVIATSGNCSQVHNAGEIWSSALWEVRALMVQRLGFQAGTTRVLQVVTDGMKLAPTNPMMLQERDAIIAAAAALSAAPEASADVIDVREGFRRRGFGFSASTQSSTAVTEAFDLPNVTVTNPFSVSDSVGDNDGFPEPTEPVLLSVAITNTTGAAQTNVTGSVTGGGTANYGTINDGQTVTRQIAYTVPGMVACGAMHQVSITASSDAGAQAPVTRSFRVGVPVGGAPATFSNAAAITINDNAPATPYPSNIAVSGLTGNKVISMTLTGMSHTFPADVDVLLVGPGGQKFIPMSDQGGGNDMSNVNLTLVDSAAAALPTTIVSGEFRPTADATADTFAAPAPAGPYTLPAPGGAGTFASTFGVDGTAMNGTWSLYVVDDAGIDLGAISGGWSLTFGSNDYSCSVNLTPRSRADFDGDGKSDVSVFRPSEGNWYVNQSTAGFSVINWGTSTDVLIPGDYDGDLKADTAVFRANADPAAADYLVLKSNGFVFQGTSWGLPGDMPISGDYDGDGKTDLSVFRPSSNTWFVLNSGNGSNTVEPFGSTGDVPMAFDLEGDGKTNLAVYRPSDSSWYVARATGVPATNYDVYPFGTTGDVLVPADYDGDNKDDVAVFRPSNGTWYIRKSTDGSTTFTAFGQSGDRAVPGDYDGDGKDDIAVYRAGTWYMLQSTAGAAQTAFGVTSDVPVPLMYIPAQGPPPSSAVTVSYTGAAVVIPDNNPTFTNVPLAVAGVGTVSDLNFRFDTGGTCDGTVGDVDCAINHTWVGDLIIRVTPPDGSPTVVIFDRPGVPASTFGCSNNNLGLITLNDEGGFPSVDAQGNPTPAACNTANLFPTGDFSPFSPLSALDGESADGNWTISISDSGSGDTGSLRRFSLVFNSGN
ncbi:MAG: M36 family metallopeptidase [Pyrinomonadaceae bacterium]|nr:M36 family metallopeptidase [Pyrinomonadaceae bacterium]MBP6212306.1 M36 family metallopeptidase [Pyrinomonadaceae bacterium]